ncbi:hypothetical protein ZHAS_00003720 [Anopheles sinensis]|uniref:Uncharacterized protein n=1 Tax=Anopheles sinensis TaxID=74873 RepID=A0A084VFB7_ANOSI|nr:hypothetical protein ZHAS_00003720 [Anopheles sinensis]
MMNAAILIGLGMISSPNSHLKRSRNSLPSRGLPFLFLPRRLNKQANNGKGTVFQGRRSAPGGKGSKKRAL